MSANYAACGSRQARSRLVAALDPVVDALAEAYSSPAA
jgi:hypothetical protein